MSNYSIDSKESSASQSKPVPFYHFQVNDQEYLYSGGDLDVWHEGKRYLKSAISHGDIDGMTDPDKGTLILKVPYLLPITQQLLVISPSFPIELVIRRGQRLAQSSYDYYGSERTDNAITFSEADQEWVGRVRHCEITGSEVTVHAISILNNQYRMGNTLRYQRACPYALYEAYNCKVPVGFLRTTPDPANLYAVSAAKVQSPDLQWGAFPESIGKEDYLKKNWFVGGFVTYFDTFANVEGRRAIIEYDHDSGRVTVFPPLRGWLEGSYMHFDPGCEHNSDACASKFQNILNYGGDPILPLEDPYDPFVQVY